MRVVVTGSDGFIGSHAAEALRAAGHDVVGMDRKSGTHLDSLSAVPLIAAARPELIVHLASSVSTPGSMTSPYATFRDTVQTTVMVMLAAQPERVPVLLTSSVKARDGRTPYGAAKVMAETWARECHAAYGIPLVVNRPGTVYGIGQQGSTESGWVAWFLRARREGLPVVLDGGGEQRRDLLHVSDYVALMLQQVDDHALGIEPWGGRVVDVGGGRANTVSVRQMAEALGLAHTVGPSRYGDVDEYVGRNDYANWRPMVRWRESDVFREAMDG